MGGRLEDELQVLRAAMEAAPVAIFYIDRNRMRIVDANETACQSLGCAREEIRGAEVSAVVAKPEPDALAAKFDAAIQGLPNSAVMWACHRGSNGSPVPVQWLLRVVETSEGPVVVVVARGASRTTPTASSASSAAPANGNSTAAASPPPGGLDPLTNLPDRRRIEHQLAAALQTAAQRPEHRFALLFLDLDGFKSVNDSFGHLAGDRVLVDVVERLRGCFRSGDVLARFGGDEFVVLLENVRTREDAEHVADRIRRQLAEPFGVAGNPISVSASIGITLSWLGYQKAEQMLHDADRAMYRAKNAGKAQHAVFSP